MNLKGSVCLFISFKILFYYKVFYIKAIFQIISYLKLMQAYMNR